MKIEEAVKLANVIQEIASSDLNNEEKETAISVIFNALFSDVMTGLIKL